MAIPALVVGAGISALGSIFGAKQQRKASKDASRYEYRATQDALAAAREEQGYERRYREGERDYGRGRDTVMDSRYADELGYGRGRDSIMDARYAEERDYGRGVYAEERDFGRGQYGNYLERLQPFARQGQRAVTNLGASTASQMPGSVPTSGGGGMIKIQSPPEFGSIVREVPASQESYWLSKGGTRVG